MELTLTPEQIVEIYRAGMQRGSDEATAYDWGSRASGKMLDNLEDCLLWDLKLAGEGDTKAWWGTFLAALPRTYN